MLPNKAMIQRKSYECNEWISKTPFAWNARSTPKRSTKSILISKGVKKIRLYNKYKRSIQFKRCK